MSVSTGSSRALRVSNYICHQCLRHQQKSRPYTTTERLLSEEAPAAHLPRVATPSFWTSLIPRFLRKPTTAEEALERARRRDNSSSERRTGIVFGILGLLVGSNAINILSIRRDMLNFTRQTDAKLELLREVVQKVKNGEEVDVRRALGTGDPLQEKEWEQVMRELEETDMLVEGRTKRNAKRAEKAEQRRIKEEEREAARAASRGDAQATEDAQGQGTARPKFLM